MGSLAAAARTADHNVDLFPGHTALFRCRVLNSGQLQPYSAGWSQGVARTPVVGRVMKVIPNKVEKEPKLEKHPDIGTSYTSINHLNAATNAFPQISILIASFAKNRS